jgi:hypothetical protein
MVPHNRWQLAEIAALHFGNQLRICSSGAGAIAGAAAHSGRVPRPWKCDKTDSKLFEQMYRSICQFAVNLRDK